MLTKPDRSTEAAHEKWVRYVSGDVETLHHGWFCVKLHDTQNGHPQPSLEEARDQEDRWFKKISPWCDLPRQARSRLRTKSLVQHLEVILSDLISKRYAIKISISSELWRKSPCRIPDIGVQIRELVEDTSHRLERLGHPPSNDYIGEINTLVDQLVVDIKDGLEHVSRQKGNVLYRIEEDARRFKGDLRATCPEFRAWNRDTTEPSSFTPLPDLLLEEGEKPAPAGTRKVIFLDEVLQKRTR